MKFRAAYASICFFDSCFHLNVSDSINHVKTVWLLVEVNFYWVRKFSIWRFCYSLVLKNCFDTASDVSKREAASPISQEGHCKRKDNLNGFDKKGIQEHFVFPETN